MTRAWGRADIGFFTLALVWLAMTLWVRPLALPDEGRYVGVAWEMLTSGNWLYPTLNSLPYFHKPPLYYWVTASSLGLFGAHAWAGRVAPWLGAAIALLTLYGFALRRAGQPVARLAALVLATQPLFFGGAQYANLDMLVAGCISATVLLAAEAALNAANGRPYRMLLATAYVSAAFGVLAKGLIGIVLPGMVIVAWLAWNRRLALLRPLLWLPGLALFALVALPWFVAMQARFPEFLNYFFVYQQFQRFAAGGFNNPMPFWFYPPVLLVLILPWSFWLPAAWKFTRAHAEERPGIHSLMWIWSLVIVGFFSIPSSKLVGYVIPALPPLAYLIADGMVARWQLKARRWPRALKWWAAVAVAICLAMVLGGAAFDTRSSRKLASLIAAQRQVDEPVVFLEDMYFDIPFYARLREPVMVVDDWGRRARAPHDDASEELYDAGRFDPGKAGALLIERAGFMRILCSRPATWIVANGHADRDYPFLKGLPRLAAERHASVWKVSGVAAAASGLCAGTPSAGSTGT